jgi:hypothetical protein
MGFECLNKVQTIVKEFKEGGDDGRVMRGI